MSTLDPNERLAEPIHIYPSTVRRLGVSLVAAEAGHMVPGPVAKGILYGVSVLTGTLASLELIMSEDRARISAIETAHRRDMSGQL